MNIFLLLRDALAPSRESRWKAGYAHAANVLLITGGIADPLEESDKVFDGEDPFDRGMQAACQDFRTLTTPILSRRESRMEAAMRETLNRRLLPSWLARKFRDILDAE